MSTSPSLARGARYALLLAPALLSACYIVPVAPRPVYGPYEYRPYDRDDRHRYERRHHRHHHHRDWRGEAPADAAVAQAGEPLVAAAPAAGPAHIDASSIDR